MFPRLGRLFMLAISQNKQLASRAQGRTCAVKEKQNLKAWWWIYSKQLCKSCIRSILCWLDVIANDTSVFIPAGVRLTQRFSRNSMDMELDAMKHHSSQQSSRNFGHSNVKNGTLVHPLGGAVRVGRCVCGWKNQHSCAAYIVRVLSFWHRHASSVKMQTSVDTQIKQSGNQSSINPPTH